MTNNEAELNNKGEEKVVQLSDWAETNQTSVNKGKKLTAKQEIFARAIAEGRNQSEAYREAYPKSRSWEPEALHNRAYELSKNSGVLVRVEKIRADIMENAVWKRQEAIRLLINIVHNAARVSDKIKAIRELNLMHGYYAPEKVDHTSSDGSMSPLENPIGAAVLAAIRRKYNSE